jgi:hypothetical protein
VSFTKTPEFRVGLEKKATGSLLAAAISTASGATEAWI